MASKVFHTFPNQSRASPIKRSAGPWLELEDGRRLLDLTAGSTGFAVLGGGNQEVIDAICAQLRAFPHADYKYFDDPVREELASILLSGNPGGLNRVFFSGGSGSEACEMALQLSYQTHHEGGKNGKNWAIATRQSYHGSTTGALAVGERPNLEFYGPLLPQNRLRIPECNFIKNAHPQESQDHYGLRAANYLEHAILAVGPDRVACFIAETMLGGLVGDVAASRTYWPRIREICSKYDIHLILDEVWCGGGVTGRKYCLEWEGIDPDFVVIGKTLAAGYAPLSAVLTNDRFEKVIIKGSGRVETSCTFQGHSTSCAAALAAQKLMTSESQLRKTEVLGAYVRETLNEKISHLAAIKDIRGRGIRNSIEYEIEDPNLFGQHVSDILNKKHGILVSGKWHRLSLTHSVLIPQDIMREAISTIASVIETVYSNWSPPYREEIKQRNFF
jgi:adenosylmethionine-8-amino-7-oxononanoate aminotransferase